MRKDMATAPVVMESPSGGYSDAILEQLLEDKGKASWETVFQNQPPGNVLHHAPFKIISANSTSRQKILHRDRAVLHPFHP